LTDQDCNIALDAMWRILQASSPPEDPENNPIILVAKLIHHPRLEGHISDELVEQLLEISKTIVMEDYEDDADRPYPRIVK